MKRFLLALCALVATAAALAQTPERVDVGPVTDRGEQPMRGSSNVGAPVPTLEACQQVWVDDTKARKAGGNYRCVGTVAGTTTYVPATAAPPVVTPPVVNPPVVPPPVAQVGVAWNPALVPAQNAAATLVGDRVRASTIPTPVSSDIPIARVECNWSHFAPDDPLVFPGQFGRSHLHMFWGNTTTNANTTNFRSDRSTCKGGAANSSGYWIAALIDTRDGRPLVPDIIFNYYKGGYKGVQPAAFQPIPAGLRMLAGDAMNTQPLPFWSGHYRWSCTGVAGQHGSIPANCTPGGELIFEIEFPQCWDGRNLDSPDHKSHMRYADGGCRTASHPVALPEIALTVHFRTPSTGSASLRISSDQPGMPAGASAHADFWNGWDQTRMQHLITNCHNQRRDCGTNLLGGGLTLY